MANGFMATQSTRNTLVPNCTYVQHIIDTLSL
jgi:hypothetical protein